MTWRHDRGDRGDRESKRVCDVTLLTLLGSGRVIRVEELLEVVQGLASISAKKYRL